MYQFLLGTANADSFFRQNFQEEIASKRVLGQYKMMMRQILCLNCFIAVTSKNLHIVLQRNSNKRRSIKLGWKIVKQFAGLKIVFFVNSILVMVWQLAPTSSHFSLWLGSCGSLLMCLLCLLPTSSPATPQHSPQNPSSQLLWFSSASLCLHQNRTERTGVL